MTHVRCALCLSVLITGTPASAGATELGARAVLERETAVGPVLDPIGGEVLDAGDARRLPSGRHTAWHADHVFLSIINLQPGDGGTSRFDTPTLSAHGRSWTQQRWLLNGLEITDPARPGTPLVDIPDGAWDALAHRSLWTSRPGFEWRLDASARSGLAYGIRAGFGAALGGGVWIPKNFMDREPATEHGAPSTRRALGTVRELSLAARGGPLRLACEYALDEHEYPVTFFDGRGRARTDTAERTSLVGSYAFDLDGVPLEALVVWQSSERSNEGAQYRWPADLTGRAAGTGVVAQLASRARLAKWDLEVRAGYGYRTDDFAREGTDPLVTDLEGEWLWLWRPRFDESLSRWRGDLHATARRELADGSLRWDLVGGYAGLRSQTSTAAGVVGQTYERTTSGDETAFVTVYDPPRAAREWLGNGRLSATYATNAAGFHVEVVAAVDYHAAGTPRVLRLGSLAPAGGIATRRQVGGGELFALLRREPDAFTTEVSSFLDPARPSGRRYTWRDDGDGIPAPSEADALVARLGPAYHRATEGLRRPTSNQVAIGWRTPRFGPFRAVLTAAGRLHLDRYTVRYDDATAGEFERVDLTTDPDGAYRLPYASRGPHHAYARAGTPGGETYLLENDDRPDFWAGTELQLVTVGERSWFVNLTAAGYWNAGGAPFGVFPDRNDPGIVDPASADPNAQWGEYGRYDQDRSFSIKLLAGGRLWERLLAAATVRYRDGEPFVDFAVIEGLPQGPAPVMLRPRGKVRHTFHMSLDARVAYTLPFDAVAGLTATLAADLFNVLGSGTELLEDSRAGESFRRSLEMMPGRTGFVSLTLER